jgi:hypothetical protein
METESGYGMLRYQTEMTDAEMLMLVVLALMPSYAYIHVFFNNLGLSEKIQYAVLLQKAQQI